MLKFICKSCGGTSTAKDFDTIVSWGKLCERCQKDSKFAKARNSRKETYDRKVAQEPIKTCVCGEKFKSLSKFCSDKCYRTNYNNNRQRKSRAKVK